VPGSRDLRRRSPDRRDGKSRAPQEGGVERAGRPHPNGATSHAV